MTPDMRGSGSGAWRRGTAARTLKHVDLLPTLPGNASHWLVISLMTVAATYLLMRSYAKRRKDPLSEMPRFSLAQQRAVERQMQNLLVELSEMSRQISAQLDTRSTRLEILIDEADRRLAQLRELEAHLGSGRMPGLPRADSRGEGPLSDALAGDGLAGNGLRSDGLPRDGLALDGLATDAPAMDNLPASTGGRIGSAPLSAPVASTPRLAAASLDGRARGGATIDGVTGGSVTAGGATIGGVTAGVATVGMTDGGMADGASSAAGAADAPDDVDARHGRIYALSDSGYSPRAIAQELGRPVGEVELILALRRRPASVA